MQRWKTSVLFVLMVLVAPLVTVHAQVALANPPEGGRLANTQVVGASLKWVAARHMDNPIPGSKCVAVVLEVESASESMGETTKVSATGWFYCQVDTTTSPNRYTGAVKVENLEGTVSYHGKGKNRRARVKLTRAGSDVQVMLATELLGKRFKPGRGIAKRREAVIMRCRGLDTLLGPCQVGPVKGKVPINCDEPPTEDVLEEEPLADPDNTGPEYIP